MGPGEWFVISYIILICAIIYLAPTNKSCGALLSKWGAVSQKEWCMLYPATCGPKGHGSGCPKATGSIYIHFPVFLYPVPNRRHPQQPTGYHGVLVGLPIPLLPSERVVDQHVPMGIRALTKPLSHSGKFASEGKFLFLIVWKYGLSRSLF